MVVCMSMNDLMKGVFAAQGETRRMYNSVLDAGTREALVLLRASRLEFNKKCAQHSRLCVRLQGYRCLTTLRWTVEKDSLVNDTLS